MVCGGNKQKQPTNTKTAPVAKPPTSQSETPTGPTTAL